MNSRRLSAASGLLLVIFTTSCSEAKLPFGLHGWVTDNTVRGHHLKDRHTNRVNESSLLGDETILTAETGTAGKIYPPRLVEEIKREKEEAAKFQDEKAMHIVYTVCGQSVKPEFLMSLKSLYLFAVSGFVRVQSFYHIHVLSDGTIDTRDMAFLRPLSNFKVSVHPTFTGATMMFKQCSTERIYLHQHSGFAKIDEIIYVDTDTLWLDDPVWWWTHFAHMRTQHALFGLAQNANSGEGSWYTNAPIPHYGERGLNAGTLMASLKALRASNFTAERDAHIHLYSPRGLLPLGDQDVLNIYGHDHPKHIYEMPCIFNFRYDARCDEGQPIVIHGNRGLKDRQETSYNHLCTFFSKISAGISVPASKTAAASTSS